jgi:hypothetical protein
MIEIQTCILIIYNLLLCCVLCVVCHKAMLPVYYERHFLYFGMIEFGMIDYW